MKKLFLICFLSISVNTFTNAHVENTKINNGICCTAVVTYNGIPQASFTECGLHACDFAAAAACNYIRSHGGSCPQQ
ncbi:MAG: hypothetical protein DRI95_07790 [Bacteroidetes bacterium]|nr:MAG: hypothetical protein DRI95_07790 [Bacteroidota bacterium]